MKIGGCLAIIIYFLFSSDATYAATEYATFESFYKESSYIGWIIAGVFALVAGAAIFFTGGTASPIVVSIGTWIGGTMGLSGIAATNAGLALLGGGSIATGGFGILGGTVLLSAALSFGTDVVIDYTVGKAVSEYKYSNLAEQSKDMPTLPIPVNDSGPNAYEEAVEILEGVNKEIPISSKSNQKVLRKAILKVVGDYEKLDIDEESKKESLLSLLYFLSNNYKMAKNHAKSAIFLARSEKIKRTLPAFIYATSALYDENVDFTKVTRDYFSYSVFSEPDNPLIPLLFSIYMDRISLRFSDGYLDDKSLFKLFFIMQQVSDEEHRFTSYMSLLSRLFMRLKLEQQKISSLVNASNKTIKDSPKTLIVVQDGLEKYSKLLDYSKLIIRNILLLEIDLIDDSRKEANKFLSLWANYNRDAERLESIVTDFKDYQASLEKTAGKGQLVEAGGGNNVRYGYLFFLILVLLSVFLARRHTRRK